MGASLKIWQLEFDDTLCSILSRCSKCGINLSLSLSPSHIFRPHISRNSMEVINHYKTTFLLSMHKLSQSEYVLNKYSYTMLLAVGLAFAYRYK